MNYQLVSADVVPNVPQTVAVVAAGFGFLSYYVYAETTETMIAVAVVEAASSEAVPTIAANGLSFS